jgi:L,D-transpeptidase catalytic domain
MPARRLAPPHAGHARAKFRPVGTELSASRMWLAPLLLAAQAGCSFEGGWSASRIEGNEPALSDSDPELGATAQATPVRSTPERDAPILGYLHAGAHVRRSPQAISHNDCVEGWYRVRPRGYVCLDEGATLDVRHPTLETMATQPAYNAVLPYAYARTQKDAPLYAVQGDTGATLVSEREIPSRSGMAIVGSWTTRANPDSAASDFALMTNGRFLATENLEQAEVSDFHGWDIDSEHELPCAFISGKNVASYSLSGETLNRKATLEFREAFAASNETLRVGDTTYLKLKRGDWVKRSEVTLADAPATLPACAEKGCRWIDIAQDTQTLIAFEGVRPVFTTLLSTGKGKGERESLTKTGDFSVVAKHITALNAQVRSFAQRVEVHDVPWLLELSSGQFIHGAYWHDQFGKPHGFGHIQLAPRDARRVFYWAGLDIPEGWHAVLANAETDSGATLRVIIH